MSFGRRRSISPWSAMWRGCSGVGSQLAGWGVGVVSPYPGNGADRYLYTILVNSSRHTISYIGALYKEERIVGGQQGSRHAAVQRGLHHQESQCRRRHYGRGIRRTRWSHSVGRSLARSRGPSHAREVVAWLRAQFPDLEMTIESIVADTDMVSVRVRSAGDEPWQARWLRAAEQQTLRGRAEPLVSSCWRKALRALGDTRRPHRDAPNGSDPSPLDRHERAELRIVRPGGHRRPDLWDECQQ
jgi:SnoaL-like polyketide cyclase